MKTCISEETGPAASIEALLSVAEYFRIPGPKARTIAHEVENAVSAWQMVGREVGMTSLQLDAFTDAFEHKEREIAKGI